jgi:ankyrin repeat protein
MLMMHARFGDREKMDLLLRPGAALDRADNEGKTALMHAAQFSAPERIRVLLAAGARLNRRGRHGLTALHLAVSLPPYMPRKQVATLTLLLDSGLDVDCRSDWGSTALHHAAATGALAAVRLLVARGASLCATANGDTALHFAAGFGRQDVVRYLLDRGADPRQLNNQGENALDLALGRKQKSTAALLHARGVKPARQ